MHFTRPRELAVAGFVGLVLGFLLVELAYDEMPRLPTFAGGTLLVLALIELVLGFSLRSRIREGRLGQALTAARAVALAKASSLLGALMAGGWLGVLGYLLRIRDRVVAAEQDMPSALIGVLSAAALIAAALWLEYSCRTPDEQRKDRRDTLGADE